MTIFQKPTKLTENSKQPSGRNSVSYKKHSERQFKEAGNNSNKQSNTLPKRLKLSKILKQKFKTKKFFRS